MLLAELPSDIIETIFDILNSDSPLSLRPLAGTSQAFREPCQRRLFARLTLEENFEKPYDAKVPPEFCVKLRSALTENPTLATYTREIVINHLAVAGIYQPEDEDSSWIMDHALMLSEILEFFGASHSPIRCFELVSTQVIIYWVKMDTRLQNAVLAILQKESIREVTLNRVTVPWDFFTIMPNLECLDVFVPFIDWDQCLYTKEDGTQAGRPLLPSRRQTQVGRQPHQISRLSVHMTGIWEKAQHERELEFLSSSPPNGIGVDLSRIQCLELTLYQTPSCFNRLLQAPSLTELCVIRPVYMDILSGFGTWSLNLSALVSLKTIVIFGLYSDSFTSDSFSWIATALGSLPFPHSTLTTVKIGLETQVEEFGRDVFPYFEVLSSAFSRLHQASSNADISSGSKSGINPGKSQVKRISLHLYFDPSLDSSEQDEVRELGKQLKSHIEWGGCEDVLTIYAPDSDWSNMDF